LISDELWSPQTDRQRLMSIPLTGFALYRTVCLLSENYWQMVRFFISCYVDLCLLYHTLRYYAYVIVRNGADPGGRSLAGIAGSNPAGFTDVCLL
jgi:hypothetical protein